MLLRDFVVKYLLVPFMLRHLFLTWLKIRVLSKLFLKGV